MHTKITQCPFQYLFIDRTRGTFGDWNSTHVNVLLFKAGTTAYIKSHPPHDVMPGGEGEGMGVDTNGYNREVLCSSLMQLTSSHLRLRARFDVIFIPPALTSWSIGRSAPFRQRQASGAFHFAPPFSFAINQIEWQKWYLVHLRGTSTFILKITCWNPLPIHPLPVEKKPLVRNKLFSASSPL